MRLKTLLVLSCFLVLVVSGHNSVWAKEIKVLSQFPMSGPVGQLPEFGWGYIDGMRWINSEGGGVNGKKITYFLEDMRYSPAVEVANFNRYAAEHSRDEFLMATGFITGGLKALIDKVNKEEKIPWLDGSFSTEVFGPEGGPSKYPYYYSLGATYADQNRLLVKWIKDNHKGPGKPRLGYVYSPTAWGRDGAPEGIAYAKKIGVDVVAEIEYPYTATAATNECMTLRKAKAQYVIYHGFSGAASYTAIFFKTAKKVIPDVQLMGTHYTTISNFMGLICGEAYHDYIGVSCVPIMDTIPRSATPMNNTMVKMGHDFAKKYRPVEYKKGLKGGIKEMGLYIGSMLYALLIQEALTRADKAGELTREGVKKALDNMVWDFKGMFGGKTFSYKSHTIPMMRLYTTKIKMIEMGGKPVPLTTHLPVTDWINTDGMKW